MRIVPGECGGSRLELTLGGGAVAEGEVAQVLHAALGAAEVSAVMEDAAAAGEAVEAMLLLEAAEVCGTAAAEQAMEGGDEGGAAGRKRDFAAIAVGPEDALRGAPVCAATGP